jgi:hypothetical protein
MADNVQIVLNTYEALFEVPLRLLPQCCGWSRCAAQRPTSKSRSSHLRARLSPGSES